MSICLDVRMYVCMYWKDSTWLSIGHRCLNEDKTEDMLHVPGMRG